MAQYPQFEVRKDLLYWVNKWVEGGDEQVQLLVPQKYRRVLM